jgi:hypothetical protein
LANGVDRGFEVGEVVEAVAYMEPACMGAAIFGEADRTLERDEDASSTGVEDKRRSGGDGGRGGLAKTAEDAVGGGMRDSLVGAENADALE